MSFDHQYTVRAEVKNDDVCVERTIRTDLEHCSAEKNYSLKYTEHITEYSDSRVIRNQDRFDDGKV